MSIWASKFKSWLDSSWKSETCGLLSSLSYDLYSATRSFGRKNCTEVCIALLPCCLYSSITSTYSVFVCISRLSELPYSSMHVAIPRTCCCCCGTVLRRRLGRWRRPAAEVDLPRSEDRPKLDKNWVRVPGAGQIMVCTCFHSLLRGQCNVSIIWWLGTKGKCGAV